MSVEGLTDASSVSEDVTERTTSVKGPLSRTTVNVSEVPVSLTVVVVFDSVMPAVSSSEVATAIVGAVSPL